MITLELTEEDIGTLIEALGDWLEVPGLDPCGTRDDTREWLRRQDAGADLDMDLREAFNRRDDDFDAAFAAAVEDTFIQTGTDAREQIKETSRAATRREEQIARNMGDGTFQDVTSLCGLHTAGQTGHLRPALAFLGAHLDDDDWPDIYLGNVQDVPPYGYDIIY